eukprot:TRINITY_DN12635_c0_g1_i1.p1 TRINITY_DN12635_c0_g1~~TRINITY_DN12635_c0_g1_i1.p1  ORF type:complete len:869 (-),score=315.23 TRINITY_DN12635_c0_g1_i1:66-2672(-)
MPEEGIRIDVRDEEGNQVLEVELVIKNTVRTLKTLLAETTHLPPLCQYLVAGKTGEPLDDSDTIDAVYFNGKNTNLEMTVIMVKTFHALHEFLAHPNGDLKSVALKVLGRLGEQDFEFARDTILACVNDPLPTVRCAAIDTLVHIGDALAQPSRPPELLRDFNKACLKQLAGRVADCREEVRRSAAEALLVLAKGQNAAIKAIKPHMKHLDKCVRQDAARALGHIAKRGDEDATKALCAGFHDVDTEVRWACAEALKLAGDAATVPAVAKLCAEAEYAEVRELAVDVLPHLVGKSKDVEEAISAAIARMRDERAEVRIAAVRVLPDVAPFEHEAAMIALCSQLGHRRPKKPPPPPPPPPPKEKKKKSDDSDEESEEEEEEPPPPPPPKPEPIVTPNEDTDERVRAAALQGLLRLSPEDDVQVRKIFLSRFTENSALVRRAAAEGLLKKFAKRDDPEVVPAMVALTMHGLGDVRHQAVSALAALVERAEKEPSYFEEPPPSKSQLLVEADHYSRRHEARVKEVEAKIEEMLGKPKTVKTIKRKRMLKATLRKLVASERYAKCQTMLKLDALEKRVAELQEFKEQQEERIAQAEEALSKAKGKGDKLELRDIIDNLKANKEYLSALEELKEAVTLRKELEEEGDGGLSGDTKGKEKEETQKETVKDKEKDKEKEKGKGKDKAPAGAGATAAAAAAAGGAPAKASSGADGKADPEGEGAGEEGAEEKEVAESDADLSDEEVFPLLVQIDDDDDEELRRQRLAEAASAAVARRVPRGPVTALVHRVLSDPSWEVQQAALEALTKLAHPGRADVVDAAKPLVTHPSGRIRSAAIETLQAKVTTRDEALNQAFTLRLQDKDPNVRAKAAAALAA